MSYKKLRSVIDEKGMSVRKIALKTGIASQDLYQALSGKKPFFPGWRKRVADALGVAEAELFDDDETE